MSKRKPAQRSLRNEIKGYDNFLKEAAQKYKIMMESAEGKAMLEKNGAKLPLTFTITEELRLADL